MQQTDSVANSAENGNLLEQPLDTDTFTQEVSNNLSATEDAPSSTEAGSAEEGQSSTPLPVDQSEAIAKVRAQERSRYESMIRERDAKIANLEKTVEDLINASEAIRSSRKANSSIEDDTRFSKITDPDIRTALLEMEARAKSAEEAVKALTAVTLRDEVIRRYDGKVIKEMISGSSPEEIIASADKAHKAYMAYFSATSAAPEAATPKVNVVNNAVAPTYNPGLPPANPEGTPAVPRPTTAGAVSSLGPGPKLNVGEANTSHTQKLANMTFEQRMAYFQEHRRKLLEEASAEFAKANSANPILRNA